MQISAVVLTKNSEESLEKTLESVTWCDEIVIIDDNSTDMTRAIAKKFTPHVYTHALNDDFAQQRNFGLEKAGISSKSSDAWWILFVDSDEIVSSTLAEEIGLRIKSYTNTTGYFMKREDTMWRRKLLYGETGNIWLLRLAKKEAGQWQGRVHEEWKIIGKPGKLSNPLLHFPHPTVNDFLKSINYYSTLRARELYEKHIQVSWIGIIGYPKIKFWINYLYKKGYKDGIPGFLVALLMSFHSFLVRGKLWQLQNSHK